MKKNAVAVLTICLFLIVCLTLTSCAKAREERKARLLAVQRNGGHYFVTSTGYVKDGEYVSFGSLITDKMKKDGVFDGFSGSLSSVEANVRNEFAYFTSSGKTVEADEENKRADIVFGYLNIRTNEITYFITEITVSAAEFSKIEFYPSVANDDYYMFCQSYGAPANPVYCVIDVKNNVLIENVTDLSPYYNDEDNDTDTVYVDGIKYQIFWNSWYDNSVLIYDGGNLEITYDYVLERSEKMREIDGIGLRRGECVTKIVSHKNRLYVTIQSEFGMFGAGELKPVVFEYSIESDSFDYIGCANIHSTDYIIKVLPYVDR